MSPRQQLVRASWDDGAQVWWAESDDIPGLVTEAKTFKQLLDNIALLTPDLIELNQSRAGNIAVEVIS